MVSSFPETDIVNTEIACIILRRSDCKNNQLAFMSLLRGCIQPTNMKKKEEANILIRYIVFDSP